MTIKDDIFGNPEKAALPNMLEVTAFRNILNLARERVWIAEGMETSIEFDIQLAGPAIEISKASIDICSKAVKQLEQYYDSK